MMTLSTESKIANKTIVRVTGVLALLFAFFHLAIGVTGLTELGGLRDSAEHAITSAPDQGVKGLEATSADSLILHYKIKVIFALILGVAGAVSAVALLLLKRWAFKGWFVVISIAALFYTFRFVSVAGRNEVGITDIGLTALVLGLLCLSWFALPKRGT